MPNCSALAGAPEEVLPRLVDLILQGSTPGFPPPKGFSQAASPDAHPEGQSAARGPPYEALALHYYMGAPAGAAAIEAAVEAAVREAAAKHGTLDPHCFRPSLAWQQNPT